MLKILHYRTYMLPQALVLNQGHADRIALSLYIIDCWQTLLIPCHQSCARRTCVITLLSALWFIVFFLGPSVTLTLGLLWYDYSEPHITTMGAACCCCAGSDKVIVLYMYKSKIVCYTFDILWFGSCITNCKGLWPKFYMATIPSS